MAAAVLITGANRGLGFEFARQYSTDGGRVFAACRNPATASELRRLAQDRSGRLNVIAMDVTDAESVKNAATQLKDVAIDVLINSAGIAGVPGQKTGNVDYESWAHVFDVNTMGPLRVLESFSDHIAGSTSGLGSLTENTSGGSIAYRSSKAAAVSFNEIASAEGLAERHIRRLVPLAFLSPKIIQAIADGNGPAGLTVSSLTQALPHAWTAQDQMLGLS